MLGYYFAAGASAPDSAWSHLSPKLCGNLTSTSRCQIVIMQEKEGEMDRHYLDRKRQREVRKGRKLEEEHTRNCILAIGLPRSKAWLKTVMEMKMAEPKVSFRRFSVKRKK